MFPRNWWNRPAVSAILWERALEQFYVFEPDFAGAFDHEVQLDEVGLL
jgi:hypothetical protein